MVEGESAAGSREPIQWGTSEARWLLLATVLGSGLAFLDATSSNVALPAIGQDLDTGVAALQWTINAYTLTLASLIILGGSLGDRYGRRRMFLWGVGWFTVASLLCGLAPNAPALIAARALQGVGAALLTPGSLAILQASFAPADRSRAVGAWSGLSGIAAAVGPLVGGWLVDLWSWRLIYLTNLPVAAVIFVVALRHVPESRNPAGVPKLDIRGAALAATGLAAVSWALIAFGERGLSWATGGALAAGLALLAGFAATQRSRPHPMVPPELFRSRQFTGANLVTVAVYAALGGLFFLLFLQLQQVLGYTPIQAGLAALPVTGLMLLLSARAGELAERVGPRWPMTAGPLVIAAGLLLHLRIDQGSGYLAAVFPAVTVFGLGLALTVAPLTATVLAAADQKHVGTASGVNNAVARTAGLIAVAAIPVAAGLTGHAYENPAAFAAGFRVAMIICAAIAALGGAIAGLTIRNTLRDDRSACPSTDLDRRYYCAVDGSPLASEEDVRTASSSAGGRKIAARP